MTGQSHESLTSFRPVTAGSDRKFGLTVGAILCALAVWPLIRHHQPVHLLPLILGAALIAAGLAAPSLLAPLNRLWFKLGLLLARVTNPIFMGVMFFGAVAPLGWLLRRQGRDLLRLKHDPAAATYWIPREPGSQTSLRKQF